MTSTRDRILAEARRQLLDGGYDAFTVAGVRDALGLSSGSMFHAFPSRAALAAEVYVEGMADYQRAAEAALDAADDPQAALRALVATHLGWIEDHPSLARWLFATLPGEVAAVAGPALAPHNDRFFARLATLYEGLCSGAPPGGFWAVHAIVVGPAQEYGRQWVRGRVTHTPRTMVPALQAASAAALDAALAQLPGG